MALAAGSPHQSPAGDALDNTLARLKERAENFAREPALKKLGWLVQMRERFARSAEQWVRATCERQRVPFDSPASIEAWVLGPGATLRMLRHLLHSLDEINRFGAPNLGPPLRQLDNGQLVVSAFPSELYDRALLPGVTAEIRLQSHVKGLANVRQAAFYKEPAPKGKVALVLGAGNVGSIPAMDTLHKLFVEGKVVILKVNPVNAYIAPVLEHAMKPLIDQGYLAIVQGDAALGSRLCYHPLVDEVHITGSSQTHDTIVWGPEGPERERRRRNNQPLLAKPISSELGNITPVNVLPGPYTNRQFRAMAENIVGMVTQNASFNCVSAKMLVLPRGWDGASKLLDAMAQVFERTPTRYAYYPGAAQRYAALTSGGVQVKTFGAPSKDDELPWTIVSGLDARDASTPHFKTEPFCSLLSVVELEAPDASGFLRAATDFCNETLWGTLNAMLFAHPSQLKDSELSNEIERAVRELRYGCIGVNQWAAVAYALASTPWGAYPGSTLHDIQSGIGWVHNTFMLEDVDKCVVSGPLDGPFRPIWSPLHRSGHKLGPALCEFEANPKPWHLSTLGMYALRA
jgi:acyl-CoA reductase-like NAD-dependent aldehyde dehydrogenase